MAGARHPDELGAGDVHGEFDAEPRPRSAGPSRRPSPSPAPGRAWPASPACRSSSSAWPNLATTSIGRGTDHLLEEADHGRADLAVAEPDQPRGQERQIGRACRPRSTRMARLPLAAPFSTAGSARASSGPDRGRHPRAAALQPAGRGGDEHDADHLGAEQVRVLLGEGHDGHAAHGVADQDHRGSARAPTASMTALRSAPSWPMLAGAGRRAAGPAVVALVPEDEPVIG